MSDPQTLVTEFHETFGHPVNTVPTGLDGSTLELRLRLIQEEWDEVREAVDSDDIVATAHELGDLIYVVYGFAITLGIDLTAVVEEIHRSNMTKLDADGKPVVRDDGKILKSDLYELPDVRSVIYGTLKEDYDRTLLASLKEERESLFTPGHINSYRRDRFERHEELNRLIGELVS